MPASHNNFGYNAANQISQIAELGQTRNFGYDNVDRLTSMINGTSNESYAFDAVGNRTSSHRSASYSYQPFNRMTATATATIGYDANGNMTTKGEGSNLWRYVWDHENRLTMAATRKQTMRYQYDALGRHVRRYIAGGRENTKFTYDGLDVVMDDDAATGVTKYQNGLGIDDKLSLKNGGVTKYFLADHLGSTVALTNPGGAVTEQTSYDSFGNQTTNLSTRYQFTGREYDQFSGFYYYRARWYDAGLGRFISEDPIGFRGRDVNVYVYVGNNGINRNDPTGLIDPAVYQDPTIYDTPTACRGYAPPYIPILAETGVWGNSCMDQGWRAQTTYFPENADAYGGAYRHCVATCYLKRRYGPFGGAARRFWDYVQEDPNSPDYEGDLAGEDAGEEVAKACGTCEKGCLGVYPN